MKQYYMRTLTSADTFEFWGGAKDTVSLLTRDELEMIFDQLMEEYFETSTPTETEINDFFWFDTDTIAEMLGYADFDTMYIDRTGEK